MRTRIFAAVFALLPLVGFCQGYTPLRLSEIHKEMDREFSLHVNQKHMTIELMKHAIQQYFIQFDPEHVYFLASDVSPFFAMSDSQLLNAVQQYNQQDYSLFLRMNDAIQTAIKRIRIIHRNTVVDETRIRQISRESLPQNTNTQESDLSTYAQSEQQLEAWNSVAMAHLIMSEYNALMQVNHNVSFLEAVRSAELAVEEFENKYLFLNNEGHPLSDEQKESLFTLHILQALTKSLDVHSQFMSPQQAENLRIQLQKEYVGVGLGIEQEGKNYVITSLMPSAPAEKSGQIKIGDELMSIDDHDVTYLTPEDVQALLQGKAGTAVELTLNRPGRGKFEVTLARKLVVLKEGRVDSSYEKVDGGILAILQLHGFYQGEGNVTSVDDMREALEKLQKAGPIKGVLLDLRDNHGGFLIQAVRVAGLFMKTGVVVVAKDSNGGLHYFRNTDSNPLYTGPLVILTSKETASAAEILSQALKDYGLAVIVGDPETFGKGSIQMETSLGSKGSQGMSNVTVGRYYSVSGYSTQLHGVKADVMVPGNLEQSKVGEEYLPDTLSSDTIAPSYIDSLSDIPSMQKVWYERYYRPYMQQKIDTYRKWIPELKKLSQKRLKANAAYQQLLAGKSQLDPQLASEELKKEQMDEATNVTKDLIRLSSEQS